MSSYIDPAPQGDPKATGAYAVGIAATVGAEGRDSAGNLAIDYVWGSNPLKPDTERAANATDLTGTLLAVQNAGQANNLGFSQAVISVASWTSANLSDGDVVTVTGTGTAADGDYTVIGSVNTMSPSGVVFNTRTPYTVELGGNYGVAIPVGALVTKSVSGNYGGGNGDKGWSKTTKKVSAKLDPTLDSHNIATEYWNNFPNYTPNAGFVPQQLWSWVVENAFGVVFSSDLTQDSSGSYFAGPHGGQQGYVIEITPYAGLDTEQSLALKSFILAGQLAGAHVPETSFIDNYGNTVVWPAGWVAGADFSPGAYAGIDAFTIQVATLVEPGYDYKILPAGTEVVLGLGEPKSVLWQGINGTDYSFSQIRTGAAYGEPASFRIFPAQTFMGETPKDMSDLIALVNSGALIGAWVGMGVLDDAYTGGTDPYYVKRNIMKIGNAYAQSDGYGNEFVVIQGITDSGMSYSYFYDFQDGNSIVIIK